MKELLVSDKLTVFNPLVASSSLAQPIKFVLKIHDLLNSESFFLPAASPTHHSLRLLFSVVRQACAHFVPFSLATFAHLSRSCCRKAANS